MNVHNVKTVPITYKMVVDAYAKVKQGGKAVGVDQQSWAMFEAKGVEKELYVVWNRMASGSYFPQPVREVEIPKKDGKVRRLGIPTIRDRIAQEVVRKYMEHRVEEKFHPDSYGYRPLKNARQALEQVRKNCLEQDWVLDMDISKFFDEIDHERMLIAVEKLFSENWVRVYVKRWLEMKVQKVDGTLQDRHGKGTPQGGVISPLLANLFLHYALDLWLGKHYPQVRFVRYADDIVVHCHSETDAQTLKEAISQRLQQVKLQLNESKTKIVYCKDYRRKGTYDQVSFEFLGFSYQPRPTPSKFNNGKITAFVPEISKDNQTRIRGEMRDTLNWRNTSQSIGQIAELLNAKLRGWIMYYGMFGKRKLRQILWYLECRLCRWLSRKHKQGIRASSKMLQQLRSHEPKLFYHWQTMYC